MPPALRPRISDSHCRAGICGGLREPYWPDGARGLPGSVRWETLRQAAYTNANVFGEVGAYDRYFRPVIANVMKNEDTEDFFVFAEEMYYTSHIAYAPVVCEGVVYSDRENTVAELPFDQFPAASRWAAARVTPASSSRRAGP